MARASLNDFRERSMSSKVEELSRVFSCVLVTGARQVGKSTMLQHIMPPDMRYVTLDDYAMSDYAKNDPMGFLEEMGEPLCIDEIQYAPELLRAIKMRVDAAGQRPGMYWLTGSQRFHMMKGVSESLAGRIAIVDLHSLSQREVCGGELCREPFEPERAREMVQKKNLCSSEELYERIWLGGYPMPVVRHGMDVGDYFRSYVQTYVERDVHALTQVGNHAAFVRLMRSAAMRTGQQLVYSDLARDAEVSPKTAAAWLSILQASGIVALLEPYYVNTTKRLSKTPKLYFLDTGLCCWLAGWDSPEQLQNGMFAGAILKTWVYGQLVRSFANAGKRPDLYYYRDREGAEVDFVLLKNGCLYPMEVKRSSSPSMSDLKWTLRIPLGDAFQLKPGIVFCTAQQPVPMSFGSFGFPIQAL
ncbi:MAG: ATP-binding protein [Akkermansia sp.]|nr:ATP-binding protein [Akkermansia sp.]